MAKCPPSLAPLQMATLQRATDNGQQTTDNGPFMSKLFGKILVVDDDEDILHALRLLLKKHCRLVHTEKNPKQIPTLLKNEEQRTTDNRPQAVSVDQVQETTDHGPRTQLSVVGDPS